MAVVQQQGSRAGLITALVIAIIAALVCAIFWMQASNQRDLAYVERDDTIKKYDDVVKDMASAEFTTAADAGKQAEPRTGAFEVVVGQRDALAKVLTGTVMPADQARKTAEGTILAANKALADAKVDNYQQRGLELSASTPLINAIGTYNAQYVALEGAKDAADNAVKAANDQIAALKKAHTDEITARDGEIAKRDAEIAKVKGEVEGYRQQQATALTGVQTDTTTQMKGYTDQIQQKDTLLATKETEIGGKNTQILNLQNVLKRFRQNTKENAVREPDGVVTRIPGDGYCYINRGQGDQISVGMTFEVYDKVKGIPPLGDGGLSSEGDGDDAASRARAAMAARTGAAVSSAATYDTEMPKGKGSIEVVSVGPGHTSQCRIIKVEPGRVIDEGDLIGNLVYDPKNKFNWIVYGDFDLDGNGVPSANDKSVIERLIVQWGGRLQPVADPAQATAAITVDTDYIVMGTEPRVPILTDEDKADAGNVARFEKLQAQKAAYDAVRDRAIQLHIPILNQNRFLYYVGYYDQRKR